MTKSMRKTRSSRNKDLDMLFKRNKKGDNMSFKRTLGNLLNKIPFNGYKTILGTALAVFISPLAPVSISVFGVPIAVQAIVNGAAIFFAGSGIAHKTVK